MKLKQLKKQIDYFMNVGLKDYPVLMENRGQLNHIKGIYCHPKPNDIIWIELSCRYNFPKKKAKG